MRSNSAVTAIQRPRDLAIQHSFKAYRSIRLYQLYAACERRMTKQRCEHFVSFLFYKRPENDNHMRRSNDSIEYGCQKILCWLLSENYCIKLDIFILTWKKKSICMQVKILRHFEKKRFNGLPLLMRVVCLFKRCY